MIRLNFYLKQIPIQIIIFRKKFSDNLLKIFCGKNRKKKGKNGKNGKFLKQRKTEYIYLSHNSLIDR